jgi:hypothetical protein
MVLKEGGIRATAIMESRKEALSMARYAAFAEDSEVIVKDENGKVVERIAKSKTGKRPVFKNTDTGPDYMKDLGYDELEKAEREAASAARQKEREKLWRKQLLEQKRKDREEGRRQRELLRKQREEERKKK